MDIRLIEEEMKKYFGSDQKRIKHAMQVAYYAERILQEVSADRNIVLASAYLHDIGIHEAEQKYGSTSGKYQEIEGPPIARSILKRLGIEDEFIETVCKIIGKHHTPNGVNSLEFQVLYEADWIVNLNDDFKSLSREKKRELIRRNFKTKLGRKIACETCGL